MLLTGQKKQGENVPIVEAIDLSNKESVRPIGL